MTNTPAGQALHDLHDVGFSMHQMTSYPPSQPKDLEQAMKIVYEWSEKLCKIHTILQAELTRHTADIACSEGDAALRSLESIRRVIEALMQCSYGSTDFDVVKKALTRPATAPMGDIQKALVAIKNLDLTRNVSDDGTPYVCFHPKNEYSHYRPSIIWHGNKDGWKDTEVTFKAIDEFNAAIPVIEQALTRPATAQVGDDINVCPGCGGVADNGHDRCDPPSPYYCTKCDREEMAGHDARICAENMPLAEQPDIGAMLLKAAKDVLDNLREGDFISTTRLDALEKAIAQAMKGQTK